MAAENVSGAPSAVSVLLREYYCSVMMCFYSVILIPRGRTTFTTAVPAASLWQDVLRRTVRFYKIDTKGTKVCSRICEIIHTYTVTFSEVPAAGAGLSTALPVHLGIASLLPCPHLFYSQGQGDPLYDGTPFITAGTITGDVSLSENFKPILPPRLSLSLSPISPCVSFLSRLPYAPFLSFPIMPL